MFVDQKNEFKKALLKDCDFNSKLFIDLDSTYEESFNNSFEDESDKSSDIDNNINKRYLLKELIEELDSPTSDSFKEENSLKNCNSISPLVNKGYQFVPKKYRNNTNKNNNKNKKVNKYHINEENSNKNNYHILMKERKRDWICKLCNNLNFGFRKKCNRCKVPKEECIKNCNNENKKNDLQNQPNI